MRAVAAAVIALAMGLPAGTARAASCCGSSSQWPALIAGDDRLQATVGLSAGFLAADADAGGNVAPRGTGDSEVTQIVRVDVATLLSDRLQAGLTLPVQRRARDAGGAGAEATGLGDVSVTLAYEALPEWRYSPWRPKGFVFLQGRAPTGTSRFEAREAFSIDARGRGFWGVGLGIALMNHWGAWDAIFLGEAHRSFSRSFVDPSSGSAYHYRPGWGTSLSLGVGVSPGRGPLRVGVALAPSWEEGIDVTGPLTFQTAAERTWTATLQASYLFSPEWSLTAAYADQVLLGGARNSGLNRTFTLSLQKRWPR